MKIYSLIIGCIFILTGCATNECPQPITVFQPVEVLVPTKPDRPKIDCDFNQPDVEEPDVEGAMLDCIILQKKVIEELTKEPSKI